MLENGEQSTATIRMLNDEYNELFTTSQKFENSPMLQTFAQDLLNIDKVSKEASEGIAEFIKYNNISEKQIQEVITALRTEQSAVGAASSQYKQHSTALQNISNAYDHLKVSQNTSNQATNQMRSGLTGMNMVVSQTGFLLSDLDMFMVNWRMGLMSTANNFSMIANSIGVAMNQAREKGQSFGEALKGSLTGFNALILGVNAGFFILQMLSRLFADNTKEIEKNTAQLDKNKEALKRLSVAELEQAIFKSQKEVDLLKKKREIEKKAFEEEWQERNSRRNMGTTEKPFFVFSQKEEFDKQEALLAQAQNALQGLGYNQKLSNRLNKINEEIDLLQDGGSSVKRTNLLEERKKLQDLLEVSEGRYKTQQKYNVESEKEIRAAITKYELELTTTKEKGQQLLLIEKIVELQNKLVKNGSKSIEEQFKGWSNPTIDELLNKDKQDSEYNKLLKTRNEKPITDREFKEEGDALARKNTDSAISGMGKLVSSNLDEMEDKGRTVARVFNQVGSSIASTFSRALSGAQSFNDILENIISILLEIGIKMAISAIPGIGPILAGSTPSVKSSIPISEGGTYNNTQQVQYLILGGSVELNASARGLNGTIDKRQVILRKHYSKNV